MSGDKNGKYLLQNGETHWESYRVEPWPPTGSFMDPSVVEAYFQRGQEFCDLLVTEISV